MISYDSVLTVTRARIPEWTTEIPDDEEDLLHNVYGVYFIPCLRQKCGHEKLDEEFLERLSGLLNDLCASEDIHVQELFAAVLHQPLRRSHAGGIGSNAAPPLRLRAIGGSEHSDDH